MGAVFFLLLINVIFFVSGEESCGHQKVTTTPSTVALGEFPWLVRLRYENKITGETEVFSCMGCLLSSKYVLTTASCVVTKNYKVTTAILGDYDRTTDPDCVKIGDEEVCADVVQEYTVARTISHPDYKRRISENDIALIQLEKEVTFTDYIQPICLTSSESTLAKPKDTVLLTGWGVDTANGSPVKIKKKVVSEVVTNEECQEQYQEYTKTITPNMLCTKAASNNEHTICAGDAGGPIMYSSEDIWYLQGIVSFGIGCNQKYLDVNTRVPKYVDWIKANMI